MQNKFPNARDMMYGANEKMEELNQLSIDETKAAMRVKKYDYSKANTLREQETDFFQQGKEMAKETRRYISASPYLHEEMLDCTPSYLHKRAAVITKYTKFIHDKYSSVYPQLCVEDVFMDVNAMSNVITIDYIDKISLVTYAASLWILDELLLQGDLEKAISYLPDVQNDINIGLPSFNDSCHNNELIEKLLYVVKNRNIDTNKKKDTGRVIVDSSALALKEKRIYEQYPLSDSLTMRQRFDSIISLIKDSTIERAINHFTESSFSFFELCLELVNGYRTQELSLCEKRLTSLEKQKELIQKSCEENKKNNSPLLVNNLVKFDEMMSEMERKMSLVEASKDLLESGAERSKLADLQRHIAVAACMPDVIKMMADEGTVEPIVYEKLNSFEVSNPYETLFALLFLFDSGDDIAWLYNQSFFIEKVAAHQLPWSMANKRKRDWQDDNGSEVSKEDHNDKITNAITDCTAVDTSLYTKKYNDASLWCNSDNAENGFESMNLAQIIFEHTNVVMPRKVMVDNNVSALLEKSGFSDPEAKALIHYFTLCRSIENKELEYDLLYQYSDEDSEEDVFFSEENEGNDETTQIDISDLKKEIERLKSENHLLHSDRNLYKKQADALSDENDNLKHELSELREIIHAVPDNKTSNTEEEKYDYPYTLSHRFVVYGGHPSWLREIKKLLSNIRFIDGTVLPNASLMINSDAVWIQSNAIGHAFYYKILDVTRTHSIPLEYFTYASAEKCAEQIIAYDRNLKDQI